MSNKLVSIIKSGGGEVDVTKLSRIYCQGKGNSVPQGLKFKDWISKIPGLEFDGNNVRLVAPSDSLDTLLNVIKSCGGEVSLPKLATLYCQGKGNSVPQGLKFKEWISKIPELMINGENVSLVELYSSASTKNSVKTTTDATLVSESTLTSTKVNDAAILEKPILITSEKTLEEIRMKESFFHVSYCPTENQKKYVAIHCENHENQILHIVILANLQCYIIDCIAIDSKVAYNALKDMISNKSLIKVVFDFHSSVKLLYDQDRASSIQSMYDLQLAMELVTGNMNSTFLQVLSHFTSTHRYPKLPSLRLSKRPLTDEVIANASQWAFCIHQLTEAPGLLLCDEEAKILCCASEIRSTQAFRECSFDVANSYKVGSRELLQARQANFLVPEPIEVHTEWDEIIEILPETISRKIQDIGTDGISEVVLDLGDKPCCWKNGKRIFLAEDNAVEQGHIDAIVDKIGAFGTDNRAGLERQLHRISCMRNRSNEIYALTVRVGRYVKGNADMIIDLLLATDKSEKSILFLGEPGSGKSTIIREVTRILSENENVCVVDTSNEIAGDGNIRHHCVGMARRMMVNTLNDQANVMIQCVQNHTPTVMVIDEIGRPMEVEAARTCKQRGVRMVASAHGSLR
jgi:stage III sporulation protein SpoIIIAA